ncbi:helix-turn-helix protein [Labedaea rhizosphaerae]|uniref:Helix-turn-helix protein n=2 Tax=Labedaea rhizosphaerae TaxID=598644 RepID=A0A4R6SG24_LABRH|nr:helix-turn-helix protein [Labedaea rhizosphaerae]
MTLAQLAARVCWEKSYIARVERGDRTPKLQFVRDCDAALAAEGRLVAIWSTEHSALTPAQLPAAPRHFVGRLDDIALLDAAANDARSSSATRSSAPLVIAIDGPPGSGKTGLALHWAHHNKSAWPDGQLYVDLNGFAPTRYPAASASAVLESFCRTLGADPQTLPRTESELAAHYRSLIAGRRLLVVLDNALDDRQVVPLLPGTGSCAVLVTSRRVLSGLAVHADAHRLHLRDLTVSDAHQLLATVIGEGPVAAESDATTDLITLTGRTPLALRIAAERVTADHDHAISELVDDLRAAADRLDGLDGSDGLDELDGSDGRNRRPVTTHAGGLGGEELAADIGPGSDTGIRAVFSWSYRTLSPPAARLFRLLGLFGGPTISTDAAAALADLDLRAVQKAIRVLRHANLVEPAGRDRIAQHALIRTYAYELAHRLDAPEDRDRAVRRLTSWYVYAAHQASHALGPSTHPMTLSSSDDHTPRMTFTAQTALAWFDAELPNMVPVTRLMISKGPPGAAWQFCAGLFGYLNRRKPWTIWRQTHELAMLISEHQDDWRGYALVTTSFAEAQRQVGDLKDSQHLYDLAIQVSTRHDDPHNTARALAGCAYLAIDCGDYDAARDYARHALNLTRSLGDSTGEAVSRVALARALSHRGRHNDARRLLTNAIRALRQHDDIHRTALAVSNLAELAATTGHLNEAADWFATAATYAADAGDHWSEARHRLRLGDMLRQLGDDAGARDQWLDAVAYCRDLDDTRGYRDAVQRLDQLD